MALPSLRVLLQSVPRRAFSSTRPLLQGGRHATISSVISGTVTPTVDHLMPVNQVAAIMCEAKIGALPITKSSKVLGVFTEHDYFTKVLDHRHNATKYSPVEDAATIGPELIVAYPDDSVEKCLDVMMKENLTALPVIQRDGHVVGAVSMDQLTRAMMQDELSNEPVAALEFSEPSHFPENEPQTITELEAEQAARAHMSGMFDHLKNDLNAALAMNAPPVDDQLPIDPMHHERAADAFSEASVFPEITPAEDHFISTAPAPEPGVSLSERVLLSNDKDAQRHAALFEPEVDAFCEPSDFPESSLADDKSQSQRS